MANVGRMYEFFSIVDRIIADMSAGDAARTRLLREFFVSVLTVLDGLEGDDVNRWRGIALVAREDLPKDAPEINDGFLHDIWSERE